MSEQSGGPGWWQASDGKWYPPEQAPTAPQPGVDPTAPQPADGAPGYAAPAAAAGGGGGAGKVIAIVVVLALLAGGGAFLLTRDDGGGGSTASFCDTAKKFQDDVSLDSAFGDPTKVDNVVAAFDQLAKTAPSEIKADMDTLNDAFKKIGAAAKEAGDDPAKVFSAVFAATAALDQEKIDKAYQNLEKFAKDKCGLDISSSATGDSSFTFDSSDFSFDTDAFDSALSDFPSFSDFSDFSDFSSFDTDSFSSDLESLCSEFGSDFCS